MVASKEKNELLLNVNNNNVKFLDLSERTNLKDISALATLRNLTQLDLSGSPITDISSLKNLHNLTKLDLTDCKNLTDISSLANLHNLTQLDLSGCNSILNESITIKKLEKRCKLIY